MTPGAEITVGGERLFATASGALYWPSQETLILSDLHFEKGSHFAARGVLLPPFDTRATLKRIAALIAAFAPKTVISLGDAFHDDEAEARMDEEDAALLEALIAKTRWMWVLGNHDPAPPSRFPGGVERAMRIGRLILRHEPAIGETGEIAGHLHPAARIRVESRLIRRRCFATDGERLVLPAFGAYAGGLNILDKAFDGLFSETLNALMLGGTGVYPFAAALLIPDARETRRLTWPLPAA